MYKTIAGAFWVLATSAGNALAHPDHGMPAVHLHWWEYALLGAAVVAIAAIARFRK